MKIMALLLGIFLGLCLVTPASAQATRTWVSGVGDDALPCSLTAPCKTFAGAISKTAVNGEINCLNPGGFGAVTITKSITIDCTGTFGSILSSSTNGVQILFDSFQATDVRKTVRLRGLTINGADLGLNGIRILGTAAALGSQVLVENMLIDGVFSGTARGISDERTGGGELSVLNTSVRDTGGICIAVLSGTARKDAVLDNVSVLNCNIGLFAGNNVKMMVTHSASSLSTGAGLQADPGSEVIVDYSVISDNGTGITGTGTIRLANTEITLNGTGLTAPTLSYGNNRLFGNSTLGTVPTAIGPASSLFGQQ